jgi:Arc/MetJ-type ribon-helix-helix transcriptional regulator
MDDDLRRTEQVSVRLNGPELDQLRGLIGYRGLWEVSDLIRAGIQLVAAEEAQAVAQGGESGARRRRTPAKKGRTS